MVSFNALAFVSLTASTLAMPAKHYRANFDLSDVNYASNMVYSTPAHLATYGGDVSFNLSNPAVPYTTHCAAYGRHLTDMFYGEFTYTCDQPAGATGNTTFTFSRPGNEFHINQTWTKHGYGSHTEGQYRAEYANVEQTLIPCGRQWKCDPGVCNFEIPERELDDRTDLLDYQYQVPARFVDDCTYSDEDLVGQSMRRQ
jgi:hypothetical protein